MRFPKQGFSGGGGGGGDAWWTGTESRMVNFVICGRIWYQGKLPKVLHNYGLVECFQGTEDAKALMKRFYALQEERVETYALFDE